VQRGEAEYPVVFDYGDMAPDNVVVWDFVKLEMELKVRRLEQLWSDLEAWRALGAEPPACAPDSLAERASHIRFVAQFERLLADLTSRFYAISAPDRCALPVGHPCEASKKLCRLLTILLAIRREAALHLGRQRAREWLREFDFALAVYGLCSAKWRDYDGTWQAMVAVVSAGMAAARVADPASLKQAERVAPDLAACPHPWPAYRAAWNVADRAWKSGQPAQIKDALRLLTQVQERYAHAVPLRERHALLLAEDGQTQEAQRMLESLAKLAPVFEDYETLCRVARTYKDAGDAELERAAVSPQKIMSHRAGGLYATSQRLYQQAAESKRKQDEYFPYINAATLALLVGRKDKAGELAQTAFDICSRKDLSEVSRDDQIWIAFTQGESLLLRGQPDSAASYYRCALELLAPSEKQMAQSAWKQVCRIVWALRSVGLSPGPVIAEFQRFPVRLEPGPLGNCGLPKGPGRV
jgi:tetratricopeptide (TPR) repeat protein